MEINRNSKCHCGSGKKYKKCCLENDSLLKLTINKAEQLKKAYSITYKKLYTYASRREDFNKICKDATSIFFPKDFTNYTEDISLLFNAYFLKDYIIQENETTLAIDYYKDNADKISGLETNIIYSIITSYLSLYKIETIENTKITIVDVLTNKKFEILDNILAKSLQVGEYTVASVMNISGLNILSEILFKITNQEIFDNLFNDITYLYNNEKDSYDTIEDFLRNNTLLFYYHLMQIISPEVYTYFKDLIEEKINVVEDSNNNNIITSNDDTIEEITNNSNSISLSPETFNKIDSEYLTDVLNLLSVSIEENTLNKVSESGWVSAAEYHIKKLNGLNITQSQIAEKYNISASTLGKRYKVVKEFSI